MIPPRLPSVVASIVGTLFTFSLLAATVTDVAPRRAPVGARVVVAGTGLDGPSTQVTFAAVSGRAVAPVVSRNGALLEVRVPSNAASGEVRVPSSSSTIATYAFSVAPAVPFVRSATLAMSTKGADPLNDLSGPVVALPNGTAYIQTHDHISPFHQRWTNAKKRAGADASGIGDCSINTPLSG